MKKKISFLALLSVILAVSFHIMRFNQKIQGFSCLG